MTAYSCVEVLMVKYSLPMTMCSCTGVLIASLDWFEPVFDQLSTGLFKNWLQPVGNW